MPEASNGRMVQSKGNTTSHDLKCSLLDGYNGVPPIIGLEAQRCEPRGVDFEATKCIEMLIRLCRSPSDL